MKILIASSEAVPFSKTGGLADVTGALLKEYKKSKQDARLIVPLYKKTRENFKLQDTGKKITVPVGNKNVSGSIFSNGDSTLFIDCKEFFDRDELYSSSKGDYPDNAARFSFFSRGILETCKALNFMPDIIHCNDWQTGLVPIYLKYAFKGDKSFSKTFVLTTIHNIGYQGIFPASDMFFTGLDRAFFSPEGIEFYGKINFLKACLISADFITTVSSNYAKEILTKEYGFGLEGVLRKRAPDIAGIINGIDYKEWNPKKDPYIIANYDSKNLSNKKKCKAQLLKECSIKSNPNAPLIGIVSRLSAQKGIDLILDSIEKIISMGANIIILGKGDEVFQIRLLAAAEKYKGKIYFKLGFQDELAHKIYAGSDIFLMPSRYEPCGLGQMIAMRYGTIPVARKTGGLADTISDYQPLTNDGTGFLFTDYTPSSLINCLKTAITVYTVKNKWDNLKRSAMDTDFSWNASAKKYIELYKFILSKKHYKPTVDISG